MNEKILNVMILIVSVIMIISFIYMFLKSFSVILDYTKVVAEDEEKENILKECLKRFSCGYKYVELTPEIHNFKFELQEKIENIGRKSGYILLRRQNNSLYFEKKY
jgi:hypothetical protein